MLQNPTWINLHGPLAYQNKFNVYDVIYTTLNNQEHKNLYRNVKLIFDGVGKKNRDLAMVYLLEGYNVAGRLTNDPKKSIQLYYDLSLTIHQYNLSQPHIATALLFFNMFSFYMDRNKFWGKAHECVKAAKFCIESHSPSSWTAVIFGIEGNINDIFAQIYPKRRRTHQSISIAAYTRAIDHYYYSEKTEGATNYLFYPLFWRMNIAFITLDMPTLDTSIRFSEGDAIYERLENCSVSENELTKVEKMLNSISSNISDLKYGHNLLIQERIVIANLYLNIRRCQLKLVSKELENAKSNWDLASDAFSEWKLDFKLSENTRFLSVIKCFPGNVNRVLENLYDFIFLKMNSSEQLYTRLNISTTDTSTESDISDDKGILSIQHGSVNLHHKVLKQDSQEGAVGASGVTGLMRDVFPENSKGSQGSMSSDCV